MKLIFVRHGETDENRVKGYLGHTNPPLNEHGVMQISALTEELAEEYVNEKINALYTSDLLRTRQTAEMIGTRLNLTPTPVFSLRELNFGDWECLTYERIRAQEPERLSSWIDNPFEMSPPHGETLTELGARFDAWFASFLQSAEQGKTYIIVTHGGPIRWFCSKWLLRDEKQFWYVNGVKHGKTFEVQYDKQSGQFFEN